MAIQDRNTLKGFFRSGQMPTETNFRDMIDSTVNKVDDGLSKNEDDGLMLSPSGSSQKLISFYRNIQDKSSVWSINLDKGSSHLNFANYLGEPVLSLTSEGNVGIGNDNPEFPLDVAGVVGMQGRIGTYLQGKIPANGVWHTVADNLNGVYAFEVTAGVGKKKTGKYALAHAIALATYGDSSSRIHIRQALYGSRRNRIQLRWQGDTFNFRLEMRTRTDYEGEFFVQYYISQLWTDRFMDTSTDDKQ